MKQIKEEQNTNDYTVIRKTALHKVAIDCGYDPSLVVEPAFEAFITARQNVTLFEGVIPLLTELQRKDIILGTITNGNADVNKIPL